MRSRAASTSWTCAARRRRSSVREVLAIVAGRRAVSAGAGSLAAEALADAGAEYLKILTRERETIAAAAALARRTNA